MLFHSYSASFPSLWYQDACKGVVPSVSQERDLLLANLSAADSCMAGLFKSREVTISSLFLRQLDVLVCGNKKLVLSRSQLSRICSSVMCSSTSTSMAANLVLWGKSAFKQEFLILTAQCLCCFKTSESGRGGCSCSSSVEHELSPYCNCHPLFLSLPLTVAV